MNLALARLSRLAVEPCWEPDGLLLDRFLAGSEAAFRELVVRHGTLVYGVCNRILHHRQDAEDAFQAAFLVLARRARDVWPRDAVSAWLHGVAYRVAQKARAVRARRNGREQPLGEVAGPVAPRLEPDTAELIDRIVRKLPEVYRAAVIACDLEGLSRKEAAGQLGWSEGTLSGRLARARKLLAERLRKVGLSLPACGFAATLGTDRPVRAGLAESVMDLIVGRAAAGVPAPVAILTEGVVPSMIAFQFKAVAVLMVACVVGYGAWAAGADDWYASAPGQALPVPTQPFAMAMAERQVPSNKISPALEPLQGQWRVLSIREGMSITVLGKSEVEELNRLIPSVGKGVRLASYDNLGEIEIAGNTLWMPYRENGGYQKREQYRIGVDDAKPLKEIDLIASGKPVARGIYDFTAPATTCVSCHKTEKLGGTPETARFLNLCQPGVTSAFGDFTRLIGNHDPQATRKLGIWLGDKIQPTLGLRLSIATTGRRPTKFGSGADGVLDFTLERVVKGKDNRAADAPTGLRQEYDRAKRAVEEGRVAHRIALADLEAAKARMEQSLHVLRVQEDKLRAAFDLFRSALKNAEGDGTTPAAPATTGAAFTVHVRPLAAAEKVIRVKATGKESVLEGLAYAAEDMVIKPQALSIWVVRDKAVLTVDLSAIYGGDGKTNYRLQSGDQLFVQVKVAK